MKLFLLLVAALTLFAATAFANSFGNMTVENDSGGNANTCTLTAQNGGTIKIPDGSTITIVDDRGSPVVPQPAWSVSPDFGTDTTSITIDLLDGATIPNGGRIKIGRFDTSGHDPFPTDEWGNS